MVKGQDTVYNEEVCMGFSQFLKICTLVTFRPNEMLSHVTDHYLYQIDFRSNFDSFPGSYLFLK